jgi:hypothetical protein
MLCMVNELDVQAPLLLIGAGRSGTTLVMRLFRSHPDIDFRGETSFLIPRLWKESFENRFWYNWEAYVARHPNSAFEPFPILQDWEERKLREHIGAVVANFAAELLRVDRNAKAWGYKELWNGTRSFDYAWTIYDDVFPRATWVHLIRNPFSFCRSAARWMRQPLTIRNILERLSEWVEITRCCQERAVLNPYFQIRYEDVCSQARETLEPLLDSIGLPWKEELQDQLRYKILDSGASHYQRSGDGFPSLDYFTERVEGLAELMCQFRYKSIPLELEIEAENEQDVIVRL